MSQIKIEITYDPATECLSDVLDGLNMTAKYKTAVNISCKGQTAPASVAAEAVTTKASEATAPSAPADTDETATENSAADEPDEKTKKITKTDVRAAATALSKANKRAELKAIFTKFGGTKLSDMKEEDYPALLKELVAAND